MSNNNPINQTNGAEPAPVDGQLLKTLPETVADLGAQAKGPLVGSAWEINNDYRHKEYYMGLRINGKGTSVSTGILKKPELGDPKADAAAETANKLLYKELVVKVNQILKTPVAMNKAQEQILDIANRAKAQACGLSAAQFLVTRVRARVLAKKLSLNVALMYCLVVDRLLTIIGKDHRGNASLGTVLGTDIQAAMDSFETEGDGPSTYNKKLAVCRTLFNDAIEKGYLLTNPAHAVKMKTGKTAKSIERLPFTLYEVKLILEAMDRMGSLGREWKILSFLALNLGARRIDLLKRCWGEFNLKTQEMEVPENVVVPENVYCNPTNRNNKKDKNLDIKPAKNVHQDRLITLPISDPLFEVLSRMQRGGDNDPLCPTLCNRCSASLSKSFAIILRKAKIEVPLVEQSSDGRGRRKLSQKSFHGFRHTLNYWLEVAGVSREHRKDFLGQTTDKAHEFYRNKKAEVLRKELAKVHELQVLLENFAETATLQPISYEI